MENASKALIIAGAILISILLISIGIMIFNSSSGLFDSAKTNMSDQEKTMFNQKFTMYESTNASGSQVRDIIRAVKTNNANKDNATVTINGAKIEGNTDASVMPNTSNNTIVTTTRYTVKCETDSSTGLVKNIVIK